MRDKIAVLLFSEVIMVMATKTVTARIPGTLHEESVRVAASRGESLNTFVEKALVRAVREQDDKEFYDSFTLLAKDAAGSDVEFGLEAQAEVLNHA